MTASFNRSTGAVVSDLAHLCQSIADVLTTPIGSRVIRRTYGSDLFAQIDQPTNAGTPLRIYAATVKALTDWEPRVRIERVSQVAVAADPGRLVLSLDLINLATGQPFATTVSV